MNRWHTRSARLTLELLEDRTLLSAASVLAAITTARSWITYAPSTVQGDSAYPSAPTAAHLQQDLLQLYDEGWRNLVTYNLLGNYALIPQIAKNLPGGKKFDHVIAGIYHVNPGDGPDSGFADPHQEELNNATNSAIAQYIDGYMIGNEGLQIGRYTLAQLRDEFAALEGNAVSQGKAYVTSEISDIYLNGVGGWSAQQLADFRALGDWWFPNMNFYCWGNAPTQPADTWNNVGYGYNALRNIATPLGKQVIVHETWYPTAGATYASPDNQTAFFRLAAKGASPWFQGHFYFVWGEAYDQAWKTGEPCNQGPNWGFHTTRPDAMTPPGAKAVIDQLRSYYTSTYGVTQVYAGTAASTGSRVALKDVKVLDGRTGALLLGFDAYPAGFTGAVRVATADVTGDGVPDLITVPGGGMAGGALLKVFDGAALRAHDVQEAASFRPFGASYTGPLYVAAGFFDADTHADLVVSRRTWQGTKVVLLDGAAADDNQAVVDGQFRPFGRNAGEVRLAVGDVNGDGASDIVCGQAHNGSRVKVISGVLGTVLTDFQAAGAVPGGVWVAVGRVNDDAPADLIVGLGSGVAARVKIYQGAGLTPNGATPLQDLPINGGPYGVSVVAQDWTGDGEVEVFSRAGAAGGRSLVVRDGPSLSKLNQFFTMHPIDVGPFVAAAHLA